MGRYRKSIYKGYSKEFTEEEGFEIAYNKVKRIKRFYSHLKVYFIVNAIIIISSFNRDFIGHFGFWNWQTFSTAFFWGIGLVIHGISVFGTDLFFNKYWEQNKIQEYMNNKKNEF